ncbi:plasmid replication protein RepC [Pseudogemmobacter faecipullorum]|uniref:Replication initiation protein RepC n=1 Tax=Pseudogemmobacter faecipullorum TaxID=2755041 RepID=A0ABS8CM97_9RHOB|nr:plasmid replication protein RepC [Pseudogemmobacter faecipullorum]MCB5410456.1 replication initiation protein RepC [Pseudogemmobacter faecipullorum]
MQHIPLTPFGRRPVAAGPLAAMALSGTDTAYPSVNKWQIQRDLVTARMAFNLSDRDLAVLAALISFWPEDELPAQNAVVFPSNLTLSSRAHGMAESTLRRHIAALVGAGLIQRRDSPNGKRYAMRYGAAPRAYGFDLSPLTRQAEKIRLHAETAVADEERLKARREAIVLQLRDCDRLLPAAKPNPCDFNQLSQGILQAKGQLRRKMTAMLLQELSLQVENIFLQISNLIPSLTLAEEQVSGNDDQNERHIQHSDRVNIESEQAAEKIAEPAETARDKESGLTLALVLEACPEILPYSREGIRHWQDLLSAACFLYAMLGISDHTWRDACQRMGPTNAAITLACLLQSNEKVKNPGAYLRRLALKASAQAFSPGPMVLALLRARNSREI